MQSTYKSHSEIRSCGSEGHHITAWIIRYYLPPAFPCPKQEDTQHLLLWYFCIVLSGMYLLWEPKRWCVFGDQSGWRSFQPNFTIILLSTQGTIVSSGTSETICQQSAQDSYLCESVFPAIRLAIRKFAVFGFEGAVRLFLPSLLAGDFEQDHSNAVLGRKRSFLPRWSRWHRT